MHDTGVEDRLRAILRSEGDTLPLTITAAELSRRHAARQRQRQGRRVSLVAAGIAALAVASIVGLSNGWLQLPSVGGPPSAPPASASPRPSSSLFGTLPDLQPTQQDDIAVTSFSGDVHVQPDGASAAVDLLTSPDGQYVIRVVCAGPKPVELRFESGPDPGLLPPSIECGAQPISIAYDTAIDRGANTRIVLVAPPQVAWKAMVEWLQPPPVPRAPVGASDDVVVVAEVAGDARQLQVSLVHGDTSTTTVATLDEASFPPDTRVSMDPPPSVSSTGYLVVPLADGEGDAAGAMLFDLVASDSAPRFIDAKGMTSLAWGPTGLLAAAGPGVAWTIDPMDAALSSNEIALPAGVSLTTVGRGRGLAWTADAQGLLAERSDGGQVVRGTVDLYGTFTPDATPYLYAPTGLERPMDGSGRVLSTFCDENGQPPAGPCGLAVTAPGGGSPETWYTGSAQDGTLDDASWAADGTRTWLLATRDSPTSTTPDLVVRIGGPSGYVDVASAKLPTRTVPTLVGLTADDALLAIDIGDSKLVLVDRLAGTTTTLDGTFAGWGDSRGAHYPSPEAP